MLIASALWDNCPRCQRNVKAKGDPWCCLCEFADRQARHAEEVLRTWRAAEEKYNQSLKRK